MRIETGTVSFGRVATTETELWQQALSAWDEIDMETVNLEVATMEERRTELIKANVACKPAFSMSVTLHQHPCKSRATFICI